MKPFLLTLSLVILSLFTFSQTECSTWVQLQNRFAAITVGDLDVTGNKITVEANFNMTGPSVDIVSKHYGANDANYLLRPVRAELTTTNGFVSTDQGASACNDVIILNKTYHAALVYDGATLKFYRNGALISSVPATGNLVTNNWNTAIGEHAPVVTPTINGNPNPGYQNQNEGQGYYDESFRGFINEVRIWNVARTQEEIKTYMNASLPDPTTQTGLLGYWVFDNLLNKQGNTAYDGTVEGLATINQTNTSCTFIADSCNVVLPVRLTNFNASVFEKKQIKLEWHAEGETGVKNYLIQRSESANFRKFTELDAVNASNNSKANNYSFVDKTLATNKTYFYRLQINELTGTRSWSEVKSGKIIGIPFTVDLYPNPSENGIVNVRMNDVLGEATIKVLNGTGQLVVNKKLITSPGSIVKLDLRKFGRGTYVITILTPNNTLTKKVVL